MKKIILGLIVFGAIAAASFISWRHSNSTRSAPAILVVVEGGVSSFSSHVAAVEGVKGDENALLPLNQTQTKTCMVNSTYEVVRLANNELLLKAKFHMDYGMDGDQGAVNVEQTLPVYKSEPDPKSWAKLNPQFSAVAYLDGTKTDY